MPSELAYTTTLYVMVDTVKEGGDATPHPYSLAKFFHHDGM